MKIMERQKEDFSLETTGHNMEMKVCHGKNSNFLRKDTRHRTEIFQK